MVTKKQIAWIEQAIEDVVTGKRTQTGEEYVHFKSDDMGYSKYTDFTMYCHGDFMPDDYKYTFIVDALYTLRDHNYDVELARDAIDSDVYNHDLLKWLSSNLLRPSYVDEAISEIGEVKNIMSAIAWGQANEKREVFDNVVAWIDKNVNGKRVA